MPSFGGKQYRTHGQAYRASQEAGGAGEAAKEPSNAAGGNEVDKAGMDSKGKNIIAIKHSGRGEDGKPKPPFHVKHEDGSTEGPMNSHEELMNHLQDHMGGTSEESQEYGDAETAENGGIDENMESGEGEEEALKSLMG